MKEKLFTLLFPYRASLLKREQDDNTFLWKQNAELKLSNEELKKQPKPDLADIMRDNMGLLRHDLKNVEPDLLPFTGLPAKTIQSKLHSLHTINENPVFHELVDHLMNLQLNYMGKIAISDSQIYAGRFNMNGMGLIKSQIQKYSNLYQEAISPPDSFDEHEIINELN